VPVDEAEPDVHRHASSDSVDVLLDFNHQHIVVDVVIVKLGLPCINGGVLVPLGRSAILNADYLDLEVARW